MANVFLDANIVFDILGRRKESTSADLKGHILFYSPLSIHIFCYVYRKPMPQADIVKALHHFTTVSFTENIIKKAIKGPTKDFEDNVQLHSAVVADSDYFLTSDDNLLKMIFFGKMRLVDTINPLT